MDFKTFETLVKANTQDSQSKLPDNFANWKIIIESGIKKLEVETEMEIRTTSVFDDNKDNITVIEDIAMALVYYVSHLFVTDINLKQKYILDYEDAKGTFLWNKFKEQELAK